MSLPLLPRRVPLLWLLAPFSSGIVVGRLYEIGSLPVLISLAFAAVAVAIYSARRSPLAWNISLSLCVLLIGMIRVNSSDLAPPALTDFPPREARISLAIEKPFNTSDPSYSLGLARVVEASVPFEPLIGRKIYYSLSLTSASTTVIQGEQFSASGVLRPLASGESDDGFNRYLSNQGVAHTLKQGYLLELEKPAGAMRRAMENSRRALSNVLSRNKRPDSIYTGAYKGLMLGQKSELSPEQKDLFLTNGTMHLFAISGLHIGVIAACIHHLLILMRFRGICRSVTALFIILLFVMITGGSASSWRALLMIACIYLTQTSKRQPSPLSALALAAMIYLFLLPEQLFQPGFQMSYFTVASILLFGLPLATSLNKWLVPYADIPRGLQSRFQRSVVASKTWLCSGLAISSSAFITSALLGAYYFQLIPMYGIPVNLLAIPIASLAIIAGFISILVSPLNVLLPASDVFNNAALVLIKSVHIILERASGLPGASLETPQISTLGMFLSLLSISLLIAVAYCKMGKPGAALWQGAPIAATILCLFLLL